MTKFRVLWRMHDGHMRVRCRLGKRPDIRFIVEDSLATSLARWYSYAHFEQHIARSHIVPSNCVCSSKSWSYVMLCHGHRLPDLNPIEYVWFMMGRRFSTLQSFTDSCAANVVQMLQKDIDHLILSMLQKFNENVIVLFLN